MSALSYRPDIDGLRAVAVLSVVLFHAGVPFLGGGYVGVDVFFVISGFLITSLVLKDLEGGSFSLAGFWERRARRILPALFFIMGCTALAGWFLLLPEDYAALGKEIAAQSVFGSNILFYKQSGYFDKEALLKPLLHTWSLAVEEQFYLLYPLALLGVWTWVRNRLYVFLGFSAVLSFGLCLLMMEINSELAFFMLPFRGWELLAGAVIACTRPPKAFSAVQANAMAWGGVAAIVASVVFYNDKTPFPGITALLPVLGAAALIYIHGANKTSVSKILSLPPMVFAGLVSYSWYLWHWPAIVFIRYVPQLSDSSVYMAIAVSATFMLAVLTWRFIERPFRRKTFLPTRHGIYMASLAGLILFGAAGLYLFYSGGARWRLPAQVVQYASGIDDYNQYREKCNKTPINKVRQDEVCKTLADTNAKPDFILWGDSHADAIAPLFYKLSEKYQRNGYILTHHGCEAIVGLRKKSWDKDSDCHDYNNAVFELIKRHNIRHVFLVSSYDLWIIGDMRAPGDVTLEGDYPNGYGTNVAAGLAKTMDALRAEGVRVYLLLDVPSAIFDPPRVLAMDSLFGAQEKRRGLLRKDYVEYRAQFTQALLKKYGTSPQLKVIDPVHAFCPGTECLYEKDGYSLYYNKGHLSVHGAMILMPLFEPYFKNGF